MRNTDDPWMLISCNDWRERPGGPGRARRGTASILPTYERWSDPKHLALDLLLMAPRDVEGP
jgi:hypothetical protein